MSENIRVKAWCESSYAEPPSLDILKFEIVKKVKEDIAKEEEDSPKDLIHKEKLAKKDKDKSEECSEFDEKKSDDKTVKLFLREISTDKITLTSNIYK